MEGDDGKKNNGVSEKPQSEESAESEALSERFNEDEQVKILKKEKDILKKQVEEKEEMIRKLKMVKMYRNKVCLSFNASPIIVHSEFILLHIYCWK